ncbi:hypothetical protein [Sporosarcina beigongshangi]|uniref:hypothetical protein n=1 Tax=Sporosarcina beigongshangi TaxID=2782538 RepID=UPI0019399CC6|nr:hypothetical protein [Sporosarcina beigongshangi]
MKKTNTHDNGVYSGRRTSKSISFFQFPLIWMLVGALGIVLINLAYLLISEDSNALVSIVIAIVGCGVAIIFYWLAMKFLARRQVTELLHQRPVSEIMFGGVVAFIFIVISTVIVVLFNGYSFNWEVGNAGSIVLPI